MEISIPVGYANHLLATYDNATCEEAEEWMLSRLKSIFISEAQVAKITSDKGFKLSIRGQEASILSLDSDDASATTIKWSNSCYCCCSDFDFFKVAEFRGEHHVLFVDSDYDVLLFDLKDRHDNVDPSEIQVHDALTCTRNYDVIMSGLRSIETVKHRVGFDFNTASVHLELRVEEPNASPTLYFQRDDTSFWLPVMPVELLSPVEINIWAQLINRGHLDEASALSEVSEAIKGFIAFAIREWDYKEPKVI